MTQVEIDRAELERLTDEGLTPYQMSKVLGFHRRTVRNALDRAGIPPNELVRKRPDYWSEVIELRKRGISYREIGRQLSIDTRTVERVMHVMGLTTPAKRISPEVREQARMLLEDGAPYLEVSRTLGVSPQWLAHNFPGHGAWVHGGLGLHHKKLQKRLDLNLGAGVLSKYTQT